MKNKCEICKNKRNNPFWHGYLYRCIVKDKNGRVLKPSENAKGTCKYFELEEQSNE